MSNNLTIPEAYNLILQFNAANWENAYLQSTGTIKNKCALGQTYLCRAIRLILPKQFLKTVFRSDLEAGIEKIIAAVNQVVTDGAHLVEKDLQQFIDETSTKIGALEQKVLGAARTHILPQAPSLQEDSEAEIASPTQDEQVIAPSTSDPETVDSEGERDQSMSPVSFPSTVAPTPTPMNQDTSIVISSQTITSTLQTPASSAPKSDKKKDKKKEKTDKKKEKEEPQTTKKKRRKGVHFDFLNLGGSKTTKKTPDTQE